MPQSTRNRRLLLAFALPALTVVGVGIAAWVASPMPSGLAARVESRLRATGGTPIALTAVAPIMREAVVATEDERFYRHDGIDLIGVLRALPYDLTHLSLAEGASTITEQLAKLVYLGGSDRNPWRKLEDAALALKLEGRYTKEQILAAYLNSAYFGDGAFGIRAASERYFHRPPAALDIAQASLLAGLVQDPSLYDPFNHPGLARARQAEVLRSLVRTGYLTDQEAAAALSRPLRIASGPTLGLLRGVDLAPGPVFVWRQLALGATLTLLALTALVSSRLPRFRFVHGILAVRLASLALALLGIAAVIRSFRTV